MVQYSRPQIPYQNVPLPYSNRYTNLSTTSTPRPPDPQMLDGDINYLIDGENELYQLIQEVVAGNIPGSSDPNNAEKVLTTDGGGNLSWIFVDTPQLAEQSITQTQLGLQSVGTPQYQNGSIPNSALGPQCVNTGNYVLNSIGTNQLADAAITSSKYADNSITSTKYAPASIPTQAYQNQSVGTNALANQAVGTLQLQNGCITLTQLAAALAQFLVPTGAIIPFAGVNAPAGYIFCAGFTVSRVTYAPLFAVIGTTYGAGDGSTTFNVPDLRGRLTAGSVNQDTGGRITTATANATNIGGNGGFEQIAININQMPSHTHNYTLLSFGVTPKGDGNNVNVITSSASVATTATGGGQPHNNMPPFLLTNYIIKT